VAANYEITDPAIAINKIQNAELALYTDLQIALREIIGNANIDDVLEKRNEFAKKLMELATSKAQTMGIMFPGELKQMFAQTVKARKEGLAALEKSRGETAALRNLLNAAKILEENPLLVQLRALQSPGNTFVFGVPPAVSTVAKSKTDAT
jgi:regulator of protease activity HflC (stomatin/prohibitin superfamily)